MSRTNTQERGIILLEAVIAVGVLVTIFTAAMGLYITSVGGVRMTNDQVIATYLAQDAMEAVIAKRQYNYENNRIVTGWLEGISNCPQTNACSVSFNADLTSATPFSNCGSSCPLFLDSNGIYNPAGGTITPFQRSISYEAVNSYTARIRARVWWMDGATPMEYELIHTMYADPN